jgi:Bacterial Ig domain/Dockerin type I domain
MTTLLTRYWARAFWCVALCWGVGGFLLHFVEARNINQYSDTISTSAPGALANHTLSFRVDTNLNPGAVFELTPPAGFEVIASTSFSERNVEMIVGGVPRSATTTASPGFDQVEIVPGSPGLIRYTLEPTAGIAAGSSITWKIGDHTSLSSVFSESFSTTTGTSTTPEDTPGVVNANATGTHIVVVKVFDGGEVANAGFSIALVEQVGVGPVDTTEEIPPFRFNGAPTSTVGGTTLSVEISLETDELATCRFSASSSVAYDAMTSTFSNTGLIFHSTIVSVTPNTTQTFYVRCVDDEGNKNTDDYLIQFIVSDIPTGNANTEGNVSGDGSGQGNDGTGDGGGSGGTTGQSDGEAPETGGSAGAGGSGGGGGGGRGGTTGSGAGGGFESSDGPYRSGDGQVIITGFAHPRARVTVLVDGQVAESATAGSNGAFSVTVDQIARGAYTFGIYATDSNNIRSTTFSTSFTVTGARTTALSNINVASTVRVVPDPVMAGSAASISGFTLPNAAVTIEVERDKSAASRRVLTATSTGDGSWSAPLATDGFQNGTHKVRARAVASPTLATPFSGYTLFGVGQAAERPSTADLNTDGKVNLTDFSILLFWWNTAGGSSNPPADINRDGRVTLTDFSIMLFNWTG